MLPSPRSSLSSFRDYYPHTSENQSEDSRDTEITLGLQMFKIKKVFKRLEWKIQERSSFHKFIALRALASTSLNSDRARRAVLAQKKLGLLLAKWERKSSSSELKRQALWGMMEGLNFLRQRQLKFCYLIGIRWASKYTILTERAFAKIGVCARVKKFEKRIMAEKGSYIYKLSSAQISIITKNVIMNRIQLYFQEIHNYSSPKEFTPKPIASFKKNKPSVRPTIDLQASHLKNVAFLHKILRKKIFSRLNAFWISFCRCCQFQQSVPAEKGDSDEIMSNVVRHMVYLRGVANFQEKRRGERERAEYRGLKLKRMLLMLRWREREGLKRVLRGWQVRVALINNEIGREIERLEMIKQQYVDES